MHLTTFYDLVVFNIMILAFTAILGTFLVTWSLSKFLRAAVQSDGYRKGLYGLRFETGFQSNRFYMIFHTLFQKRMFDTT